MHTTLDDDTNCKIHGVTLPQNSNKIPIVILCDSEVGAAVQDNCSKYKVHNWHNVNA